MIFQTRCLFYVRSFDGMPYLSFLSLSPLKLIFTALMNQLNWNNPLDYVQKVYIEYRLRLVRLIAVLRATQINLAKYFFLFHSLYHFFLNY